MYTCTLYIIVYSSEDGISIPSSYNSYLAPVLAHKLHTSIEDCKDHEKVCMLKQKNSYKKNRCTQGVVQG